MTQRSQLVRFAPHVRISVQYVDRSTFGGPVSERLQENMKKLCSPIYRALDRHGPAYVVHDGERLLKQCFSSRRFKQVCDDYPEISQDVLFPKPRAIVPDALVLTSANGRTAVQVDISPDDWCAAADWVGEMSSPPLNGKSYRSHRFESLTKESTSRGFLVNAVTHLVSTSRASDVTYVGHNTVVVRSKRASVIVDPWFFPHAQRFLPGHQPLRPSELGSINAALVTHSHPDHFDPGSLLMLGRTTRIIVPVVPRESILSVDIKRRLGELGFTSVTALPWWKKVMIGDICVTALPFYGEQPTSGKRLYPEVRNSGNCYLVRTPRAAFAFVGDSGSDLDGSVGDVAAEAFDRYGPIDVLFSGYRGWSLYPIQYFESSVRQYLLFVPPAQYAVRQTIMNSADEAVNTAEAWHATYLVPYANGGAVWYSEIGLGPTEESPQGNDDNGWVYFDPRPEICLKAVRARSQPVPHITVGSPVKPLVLRPGQSFNLRHRRARLIEDEPSGNH